MSDAVAGGPLGPRPMTIDEMLDRAALRHLVSSYGHGIDRRDYALLTSLYHDDAIDDHSPYFVGSAADYVAWLPGMLATWSATAHSMIDMLFLIDGDRAEGVISARAWHRTADGTAEFIAWGRYADRYEKRAGVWRFLHRCFILDATEQRPASAGDDFGTDGVAIGRAGRDDPLYHRLPLFDAARSASEDPIGAAPQDE